MISKKLQKERKKEAVTVKFNPTIKTLLAALKKNEAAVRASIRQAETYMQNIEKVAKERKAIRYYVNELSRAANYYSFVAMCMDKLETVMEIIAEIGINLETKQRDNLSRKIKDIIKTIKECSSDFDQEKAVVKKLETLCLKIEIGKIKKTIKK